MDFPVIQFIVFLSIMQWGMTSLMFASKQGHLDVVIHLLKDKNLDINAQENVKFQGYYCVLLLLCYIMLGSQVQCSFLCHSMQTSGNSS